MPALSDDRFRTSRLSRLGPAPIHTTAIATGGCRCRLTGRGHSLRTHQCPLCVNLTEQSHFSGSRVSRVIPKLTERRPKFRYSTDCERFRIPDHGWLCGPDLEPIALSYSGRRFARLEDEQLGRSKGTCFPRHAELWLVLGLCNRLPELPLLSTQRVNLLRTRRSGKCLFR
jgi:hypothetical protein